MGGMPHAQLRVIFPHAAIASIDATPRTEIGHRFSPQREQVGEFPLSQLRPLGYGPATGLSSWPGKDADHEDFSAQHSPSRFTMPSFSSLSRWASTE